MEINIKSFKTNWDHFRKEVIELDNHTCVKCGRTVSDEVVLQVHHKKYIAGKLPWDYSYSDCETLCKGCHAELHGKIPPKSGWTLHYYDDFGDISEKCDYCGTDIRYVFYISHPSWEPLGVGTICCDDLTSTTYASELKKGLESYSRRLKCFIESPKWNNCDNAWFIIQKKYFIGIELSKGEYQLIVNSVKGKLRFKSLNEAKTKVFNLLSDGSLENCFKKINRA
ncbi:MAG: HNH endonuclease [Stygiobacter sp.]|nr:MAG: HNH endonuclease [Stygiobacter sp.]